MNAISNTTKIPVIMRVVLRRKPLVGAEALLPAGDEVCALPFVGGEVCSPGPDVVVFVRPIPGERGLF